MLTQLHGIGMATFSPSRAAAVAQYWQYGSSLGSSIDGIDAPFEHGWNPTILFFIENGPWVFFWLLDFPNFFPIIIPFNISYNYPIMVGRMCNYWFITYTSMPTKTSISIELDISQKSSHSCSNNHPHLLSMVIMPSGHQAWQWNSPMRVLFFPRSYKHPFLFGILAS